jgi:hypothetical protein
MAKLPRLKECYERQRKDGLQIVGVSFDQDLDTARKACKENGITWPQVFVPGQEEKLKLWEQASQVDSLPRLLLIDREGVLRADCSPGQLEGEVSKLLEP